MGETAQVRRYRFGEFEVDGATAELRRRGLRVKLHLQPFQVLLLLLERPGEMLTREEICRRLWPDGTFVDYEHGLNSAVNRLREALGDKAANPRFIETLARRGYRFVAPVESIGEDIRERIDPSEPAAAPAAPAPRMDRVLASPEELPRSSPRVARVLFLLLQLMYLAFYVAVLAHTGEVREFLSLLSAGGAAFAVVIASAALLIPVRVFWISALLFRAPGVGRKFLKVWPLLLAADAFWSLSPFLLRNMNFGLALACMTLLVYSPFAQRSLMMMSDREAP